MIYTFYILAALLIIQGIFSLVEGLRYREYVRKSFCRSSPAFTPKVSIIAPCKGMEAGLEDNLRALFKQDYPDYEIIFAVASSDDASLPAIKRAQSEYSRRASRLVVAGPSDDRAEKVNNLLCAVDNVRPDSEAFVFVDSDARVRPDWLSNLVSWLAAEDVGAVTGYRWYLPERGGFWSAMLSAWNGSVATTLGDHRRNFAWGGSTAILKEMFERFGVSARWRHALSDDYALTRAVQDCGLFVKFEPRCLLVSREDISFTTLLEFTTRQITITRVYRQGMWWVGISSHFLFVMVFFGGIAFALGRAFGGGGVLWPASVIALIYGLGSAKGALRLAAAQIALPAERSGIARLWWMFCFLWPLVSILFLYNFAASATTRRIEWRGVLYEMRSPTETIVLTRANKSLEAESRK